MSYPTNPLSPRGEYPSDIETALQRLYGDGKSNIRHIAGLAAERRHCRSEDDIERLKDGSSEAPVIRLVNLLIGRAAERGASDTQKRRPLFISTLAELSRILPDDTSIDHLQMVRNEVRIQGYSRSASHLIAEIQASHLFSKPHFEAPLTSEGANTQRFDLSFGVAR